MTDLVETDIRQDNVLPALPTERILIDTLPKIMGSRALVVSPGRGQTAWHLAQAGDFQQVESWYMDTYDACQARIAAGQIANSVHTVCGPDLPDGPYDLVAMPVLVGGEAELTRELMQQAHLRLVEGGMLVVSVDNPRDQWLRLQMQELFDKVTVIDAELGRAYLGRKTKQLKRVRDFACDFSFRDDGRLIQARSRPGVFSHRRLDAGARQLLLSVEIEPDQHIVDMGCGSGVVCLAVAQREKGLRVFGIDSCTRAIGCLQSGVEANRLENITPIVNHDGEVSIDVPVDVVLANPPYYGDFRIAEHFLNTAHRILRPGGAVLVVTKQPRWYQSAMADRWQDPEIFESGKYFVACGRK